MDDYTVKLNLKIDKSDTKLIEEAVSKGAGTGLSSGMKDAWGGISRMLKNDMINLAGSLISSIKDLFKNAIDELTNMLEYSQLSNVHTRELAFGYGFSASEAYGWDKAMSMLGFQSEEDLFYANTQELQQFREAFEKYSNYYNELYDSGFFKQMQEFQYEWQDFKNEMQMELISFFMDNKDIIMSAMQGILTITEWVVKGFSWLLSFFGEREATTSADVISQYVTTNQSSTNNNTVNQTNTFNNVDSSTANSIVSEIETQSRIAIEALGG